MKKRIASMITICCLAICCIVVPFEVDAAGQYTSLEQYVQSRSYIGDSSELYYGDVQGGWMYTIFPNTKEVIGDIGYCIADFDADGTDELLTFGVNEYYRPVISVSELENGNVVKKAEKTLQSYAYAKVEVQNYNCFIFPMNGRINIGVENEDSCWYLGNGYAFGIDTFTYDNGKLNAHYSDGWAGDESYEYEENINGYRTRKDAELREAGFDFPFGYVLNGGLNTNYSDFISGAQKVCGFKQRVTLTEPPRVTSDTYIPNYTKIMLYNLGSKSSKSDGKMFRLYNKDNGEHFYTGNNSERSWLISTNWDYEGVAWNAPSNSETPVYRLYNKYSGEHHYTTNKEEKDYLETIDGWNYEGIGWYSDDKKSVPLYRLFNPNSLGAGAHHYTKDVGERDYLTTIGWNDEGIGWYGL